MRKGIAEGRSDTTRFHKKTLQKLANEGYRFVQVKGLTSDHHYEHVAPYCFLLVPLRALPKDPGKKDVYAPISSGTLLQWATAVQDSTAIFIAGLS